MNTRRIVLHLIIGLLTFLIGVTFAIALGGFDPMARFTRQRIRRQYMIPPQTLSAPATTAHEHERSSCPYTQPRTADLQHQHRSLVPPPPPVAPTAPFSEKSEGSTLSAPRAGR